jgi:hypothetical protein
MSLYIVVKSRWFIEICVWGWGGVHLVYNVCFFTHKLIAISASVIRQ